MNPFDDNIEPQTVPSLPVVGYAQALKDPASGEYVTPPPWVNVYVLGWFGIVYEGQRQDNIQPYVFGKN